MTIREIVGQLFELDKDGVFNGVKFTEEELEGYIEKSFESRLKLGDRLVMSGVFPDGEWLFTINRFGHEDDEFDYTIPDTRKEEDEIWWWLMR